MFGNNPESVRTIFRTRVWKNLESGEGEGSDGSQDDGQRWPGTLIPYYLHFVRHSFAIIRNIQAFKFL